MGDFFKKKEVKELKELIEIVISLNHPSYDRRGLILELIPPLYKKVSNNIEMSKDGTMNTLCLSTLCSKEIIDFCFDNKCSVYEVHLVLAMKYLSCNTQNAYQAIKNIKNPTLKDFIKALLPNGNLTLTIPQYRMDSFSTEIKKYLDITMDSPKAYQEMIDNSYEEIKKIILKNLNSIDPILDIKLNANDTNDEVEYHKKLIIDKLEDKRVIANIKREKHYLSPLLNSSLTITNDNRIVYAGFTEGLSIGFTAKAIKINMDKNRALDKFKILLKAKIEINKLERKNYSDEIKIIKECINFIENTEEKYIPFKHLSKKIKISKSQIKKLCEHLFSVSSVRLPKQFDNITPFPTTTK